MDIDAAREIFYVGVKHGFFAMSLLLSSHNYTAWLVSWFIHQCAIGPREDRDVLGRSRVTISHNTVRITDNS